MFKQNIWLFSVFTGSIIERKDILNILTLNSVIIDAHK